jgi:hypothetical protein
MVLYLSAPVMVLKSEFFRIGLRSNPESTEIIQSQPMTQRLANLPHAPPDRFDRASRRRLHFPLVIRFVQGWLWMRGWRMTGFFSVGFNGLADQFP